jgi:xylulokinase
MMKTVLGIDNGTQSTKVLFYDFENKKVAASASAPHDLISKDDGTREQKAEWWITALKTALDQIDPDIKKSAVAIGVSGQQHGFVPVDANGSVLHNVKLWCDTSTAPECGEMTGAFGSEQKLLDDVGNLIMPGYTASKVLWLKKNNPDLFEKMDSVLLPHDYLNFYLTGKRVMEYGDASGTGFLNIRDRKWQTDLMETVDPSLPGKFPELIEPDRAAGTLTESRAAELGLTPGIPVSSGGGDNMMGAVGTGTIKDGVLTMSMGTSGTLYGYSDTPVIDPDGILASFCSSTGGWLPLLCTMNCTVSTELMRGLFEMDVRTFDDIGNSAEPGSGGIVILPFFNGERIPNLPNGKGNIMGMTMSNFKKENIFRASLESAVFGMKTGLDQFIKLGYRAREIRLIGGGANSPVWRQMTADILGLPVLTPSNKESAAMGGAVQALWCMKGGGKEKLESLVDEHISLNKDQIHQPDTSKRQAYDKAYGIYTEYLEALSPLYR